jgi:hypothetical protein
MTLTIHVALKLYTKELAIAGLWGNPGAVIAGITARYKVMSQDELLFLCSLKHLAERNSKGVCYLFRRAAPIAICTRLCPHANNYRSV